MPTAPDAFTTLPAIARHQAAKTSQYRHVTGILPRKLPIALDYALAHHALEGAERAARAEDTSLLNWYLANPDAGLRGLSRTGTAALAHATPEDMTRSEISETPYYVLGPHTSRVDHLVQHVTEARAHAAATGFVSLLERHAPIVCLMHHKDPAQTLLSWSITRLPGTVFTDYTHSPRITGRDLVHEAGHNWLNDALAATHTRVDEGQFFSPWRNETRPAFGFLHACWAFPLTMLYASRLLKQGKVTAHEEQFFTAYLGQQRGLLAQTEKSHPEALRLVEDEGLANVLAGVYERARSV
ncbi:HEXXH motif-containing putative peptide modification protein [Streptomyces sp. CS014]|uniref:aKG-HExxH-type peptide beta-hydroxylase n=1 Tax=Streptomyces sp. CS014 TaxID=2162707 RepID=UPI000D51553A|nr:HEXXH motif-containing putative peptide modification protein [Streptomyces sp. CS014]PVD04484.1 HEXXH motif domain-containing protein [Streptomyces sp. CS014]